MAQHKKNENVAKIYSAVERDVERFISLAEKLSLMPEIKVATEQAPKDIAGNRTFEQIFLDDAIDAFTNIVSEIKRQLPNVEDDTLPVEIYQQLLNARHGSTRKTFDREDAKKALSAAIQQNISTGTKAPSDGPDFYNVIAEHLPSRVVSKVATTWSNLVNSINQLFFDEEAPIADTATTNILVALAIQFNKSSEKTSDDQDLKHIELDGVEKEGAQETAIMRSPPAGDNSFKNVNDNQQAPSDFSKVLQKHLQTAGGIDLTEQARKKEADPIFGRADDMQNLVEIMLQKERPHALLHGDEGIGMTATVQGLANRIAEDDVPQKLKGAHIISINLATIVHSAMKAAGPHGGPDPQKILGTILDESIKHNQRGGSRIILHVEDIGTDAEQTNPLIKQLAAMIRSSTAHTLKSNSADLSLILELPEQHLEVLKSTDPLILKSLTAVTLKALPKSDVMEFLNHHAPKMEKHHGVSIPEDMLEHLVKKTDKFMPNQHQPEKAIHVIGTALARAEAQGKTTITEDDIDVVVAKAANLPKTFVGSDISDRIDTLKDGLLSRIFGQDEAVTQIADTIALVNDGMHDPKKPLAVFYLTGPTGVGKTELARSLAAHLFDDEGAILRVDMGQFHDKHTISRLVGSPPGYIGYGDKGELDDIEKNPFSIILFDEAEKSHHDIDNALLPVLDEGRLVKMDGKKLDFRNSVIILTSNLGAVAMEQAADRTSIGFGDESEDAADKEADIMKVKDSEVKKRLKPEFRGRTTQIHLKNLDRPSAEKIALIKVEEVSKRLRENKHYKDIKIEMSPTALAQIMDIGYNVRTGARPMAQAIVNHVQIPLRHWMKDHANDVMSKTATLVVDSVKDNEGEGEFTVTLKGKGPAPAAPAPAP